MRFIRTIPYSIFTIRILIIIEYNIMFIRYIYIMIITGRYPVCIHKIFSRYKSVCFIICFVSLSNFSSITTKYCVWIPISFRNKFYFFIRYSALSFWIIMKSITITNGMSYKSFIIYRNPLIRLNSF